MLGLWIDLLRTKSVTVCCPALLILLNDFLALENNTLCVQEVLVCLKLVSHYDHVKYIFHFHTYKQQLIKARPRVPRHSDCLSKIIPWSKNPKILYLNSDLSLWHQTKKCKFLFLMCLSGCHCFVFLLPGGWACNL